MTFAKTPMHVDLHSKDGTLALLCSDHVLGFKIVSSCEKWLCSETRSESDAKGEGSWLYMTLQLMYMEKITPQFKIGKSSNEWINAKPQKWHASLMFQVFLLFFFSQPEWTYWILTAQLETIIIYHWSIHCAVAKLAVLTWRYSHLLKTRICDFFKSLLTWVMKCWHFSDCTSLSGLAALYKG